MYYIATWTHWGSIQLILTLGRIYSMSTGPPGGCLELHEIRPSAKQKCPKTRRTVDKSSEYPVWCLEPCAIVCERLEWDVGRGVVAKDGMALCKVWVGGFRLLGKGKLPISTFRLQNMSWTRLLQGTPLIGTQGLQKPK